jgi:hypothetical protein
MKRLVASGFLLAWAATLSAGYAAAQVQSHVLPADLPTAILPPSVTETPKHTSKELSVPLVAEERPRGTGGSPGSGKTDAPAVRDGALDLLEGKKPESGSSSGGGGVGDLGNANATTLAEMTGSPRQVVDLLEKGKLAEAAALGRKLLALEPGIYNDFVWDYVAEATAWAAALSGDFVGAAEAHRAGQERVRDPAVKNYHDKAATLMSRGQAKDASDAAAREMAAKLVLPESWRQLVLEQVATEQRNARRAIEQMQSARTVEARLNNIKVAWANLRFVYAADPKTGRDLVVEFKAAADALIVDTEASLLDEARKQHAEVARLQHVPMKPSQIPMWNEQVRKLWGAISEVKRVCRIHDYLSRQTLASPGAAQTAFDAAHQLLYEPGSRGYVYKLMGQKTPMGLDMTRTEAPPP